MSLLSPLSLLLLLPLAGVIVLLYLLKPRRKERLVSSTMLWRESVADIQANAPFQKLKKNLLLFLQILAVLLLVIGLAKPFAKTRGISDHKIVVILDSSASMQSTDVKPSRFEKAKAIALDTVRKMGAGDTMLAITAGAKTRVVTAFTSDKKTLASSISQLQPVDTPCNMRQALVLAMSLVAGDSGPKPRIVVLSDGGFSELSDLPARKLQLDFIKIGSRCDNVAISGLDSRKTLSGDQQVFIGMRNFSDRSRTFNLEIYLNDQMLDVREETLGPGEVKQELLENVSDLGGRVTAKLDLVDDLAVDNTGSVYLEKPRKINALMVSKGNIFLQNALNLDPRTQLTKTDSLPADFGKTKYDLVVFDRVEPPSSLPPGGYLLIDAPAASGPSARGADVSRPAIVDFSRNHPASSYVDFSTVRIAGAHYLKPKPWAATIVEGENGALGVAGSYKGRSFVELGFNVLDSDFPLRVGFPIFVANCIDWLVPQGATAAGATIRAGEPARIDVPPETRKITVEAPDGSNRTLAVTQTPVIYDNTEHTGVYHVRGQGISREFACNLASSQESQTKPKDVLAVEGKQVASMSRSIRTNREFYGLLILLALAVLTFEWYAYHRRL